MRRLWMMMALGVVLGVLSDSARATDNERSWVMAHDICLRVGGVPSICAMTHAGSEIEALKVAKTILDRC